MGYGLVLNIVAEPAPTVCEKNAIAFDND